MNKNFKQYAIWAAAGLIVIGGIYFFAKQNSAPGKLDGFAQCLKDKGATFYGAFWCPHCQNQKKMFGRSAKFLPYVECSTPDGQGQFAQCKEKDIKSYPTWEFADKNREIGEVSLERLSEKTGCPLPSEASSPMQ